MNVLYNIKNNKWQREHPINRMIITTRYRAKKLGIPFNITKDDIRIPKYCPILHIKMQCGRDTGVWNSPSIDRINPKKGYVKGNIQIISVRANTMKQDATPAQLKKFAQRVLNTYT